MTSENCKTAYRRLMAGRQVPGTFIERFAYLMLEVGTAPDGTVAPVGLCVVGSER